ncbi:ImmA/IrrE family metallo-endopeptidase [Hominifimenecus sp. rT4P-3]|uniref:ImmA/IrrE family metallo-endopeptidase n=1 Tax=Hominifimenecus sp. rT4P-3 TaxID=3242979 RepID=UPI003DA2CF48
MLDKIKKNVAHYVHIFETRDPFKLAEYLKIIVQIGNIGECLGCYMFLKNHKYIFLNQNLDEWESRMVLAHELGHAVMHRKKNCYFLREKTLLLPGLEQEANIFAAELLIPEEVILEHPYYSVEQLSRLLGYREEFIRLKLKNMSWEDEI